MLIHFSDKLIEAGCDEAGRGCLAGPVVAAACILPKDFFHPLLNDSKKIKEKDRFLLREIIQKEAIDFAIGIVDNTKIDSINILNASILAMHLALDKLKVKPEVLVIDGNRFKQYNNVPHQCIVKGDGKILSIAAASILAKTERDLIMDKLHLEFPVFDWKKNKAYPTLFHRKKLLEIGPTMYHRNSFKLKKLNLDNLFS
jgi:ribonuclease HII